MDILTIAGLLIAFGSIIGGMILEGGHVSSIIQPTAAIIVFGGTIGAVCVSFPMSAVKAALKDAALAIKNVPHHSSGDLIKKLIQFAQVARKDGLLALEEASRSVSDPFMRKSLNLVVDGVDAKVIRSILESEIGHEEEYGHRSAKVFEAAGAYCPTVGILGAVLGLIHVMENLSDPSKLGGGIAVAFVATVYGVAAANLVFLPMGSKMKLKHRLEIIQHELVMEGVLGIQTGEQPNIIEERLKSLLTELERKAYRPEKKA